MKTDKINQIIHEALGWSFEGSERHRLMTLGFFQPGLNVVRPDDRVVPMSVIKDYTSDLNLMHEAEMELHADKETGKGGWSDYGTWLQFISNRDGKPKWYLNSEQRAEAFVLTLNLWEP